MQYNQYSNSTSRIRYKSSLALERSMVNSKQLRVCYTKIYMYENPVVNFIILQLLIVN